MKAIFLLFFLGISLLQPSPLSSIIRECASIQEVVADVTPETFVIFDIDNTLLRPCQMIGSDEWFDYYLRKTEEELHNHEEAISQTVDILHGIYSATKVRPLEKCTSSVVHTLQNQGMKMIALTGRAPSTSTVTVRQLRSIGIDMNVTAPSQASFPLIDVAETLYFRGVLFTCGKSKKEALSAFFKQLSWIPKRIIVIDDRKKHLDDLSGYEREGIEVVGLRFNGADTYVKAFDSKISDVELEAYLNLMQDNMACEYVQKKS